MSPKQIPLPLIAFTTETSRLVSLSGFMTQGTLSKVLRPIGRLMLGGVFPWRKQHKVAESIVSLYFVDVVNDFVRRQRSSKVIGHDLAMLENFAATRKPDDKIAAPQVRTASSVAAMSTSGLGYVPASERTVLAAACANSGWNAGKWVVALLTLQFESKFRWCHSGIISRLDGGRFNELHNARAT